MEKKKEDEGSGRQQRFVFHVGLSCHRKIEIVPFNGPKGSGYACLFVAVRRIEQKLLKVTNKLLATRADAGG